MDIINYAKNIAAVLATASTIAYVSGYLAVRARAHTLGTDPAFKLVDEAYAFAGFRFLFLILIVLLLSSPVIVGLRALLMWLMRQLPGEMVPIVHWIGLVAVAATTIALLAVVLTTNGVLLDRPCAGASYSTMEEAVLGMRPTGMLLFFVISVITALSLLWLHSLLPLKEHLLAWILTLVVAIQLVILPILHGALHADRKVRLLVEAPEKIKHLGLPLGIVDRTSEYVTIMGCDVNGGRQLVNLKLDDINGIPIKKIVSIKEFVGNGLLSRSSVETENPQCYEECHSMSESKATDTNENRTAEKKSVSGIFTAVTEFLRITFEQIGSLGDSGIDSGQLWSVEISESGNVSKPRQIGTFSDLSWPVISADGSVIYALQRGKLVMLTDDDHSIEVIDSRLRWRKLLGIAQDGSVLALVYDEGETLPTLVKPGGEARVEQSPLSPEQQTQVSLLTQESRSYSDGRRLLVDRSERGGRGFDLYMEVGSDRINVSDCGHHRCGQGSISPDFRRILYIRKPRY